MMKYGGDESGHGNIMFHPTVASRRETRGEIFVGTCRKSFPVSSTSLKFHGLIFKERGGGRGYTRGRGKLMCSSREGEDAVSRRFYDETASTLGEFESVAKNECGRCAPRSYPLPLALPQIWILPNELVRRNQRATSS